MTFKTAKKVKLTDENGNAWYLVGIVNCDDEKQQFNTVTEGYNLVQHQEVVDLVNGVIEDKHLVVSHKSIDTHNDGGRIRIDLTFPEIALDVEENGQKIPLRCTYDNSYDGSTGLRLEIGARSPNGRGFLWVSDIVKALEENYYHKHTKGLCIGDLEENLTKGITAYETKIKDHFNRMVKTPMTQEKASSFLEETILDSKYKGANKYVELISRELAAVTIKNKWQFYCMICDVLSTEIGSLDNQERQLNWLISRLHKKVPSLVREATKTEIVRQYAEAQGLEIVDLKLSE